VQQVPVILSCLAPIERRPCLVTACRMRSIPAAVLGPVLRPPCSLQRPFGIAGHLQELPRRFIAPHRGALEKSPEELPFLSLPRRLSWGVPAISAGYPHLCHLAPKGVLFRLTRYRMFSWPAMLLTQGSWQYAVEIRLAPSSADFSYPKDMVESKTILTGR